MGMHPRLYAYNLPLYEGGITYDVHPYEFYVYTIHLLSASNLYAPAL